MADVELDVTFESSNVSLDTDFGTVYVIDGDTAVKVIANKYSSERTYAVGEYVIHESLLYRCTTAIDEPEEFDSEKWLNIKLADDVQSVKSALDNLSDVVDGKANSADVTSALANKMNKTDPTGSGSLSLNRKPGDIGSRSVTVGDGNTASGPTSFAAGRSTIANHRSQHVFGEFNTPDDSTVSTNGRGNYIEIIGNGTDIRARSNARTLDWQGNETLAGNLIYNGNKSLESEIQRLDDKIDNLPEPMVFKGTLGVGGTIETLPTASAENEGWTFKCITAGTYAGLTLKVGDTVTCFNPPNTSVYEWEKTGSQDTDTDTWRNIKVNGVEKLGNGISSGAVDFEDTDNIEVEFDANGNKVGFKTKNIYTKTEVDSIVSDAIYNVLPDDTASGAVANFNTSLELPIKSLEVDVNAVQESGTPTPATPLPIEGWSAISLVHCGKNLLSPTLYKGLNYNPTVGTTVTLTESPKQLTDNHDGTFSISTTANWETFCMIVPIKSTTYYRKTVISSNGALGTTEVWLDKNLKVISTYNNTDTTQTKNGLLTIPNNASYFAWVITNRTVANSTLTIAQPQIELGSTATEYEPYVGNEYIINLGGTYYGGHFTQDKDGHRQFEVTHALTTVSEMDNNRSWYYSTSNGFWINEGLANTIVKTASGSEVTTAISDYFETVSRNNLKNADDRLCVNTSGYACIYGSELPTTKNEFLSSVGNAKLVYPLATPYTIDLPDGEPIITLNGTNNIYADTGDTEVVFKDSVNGYVEKKIASVQALALNT